MMAGSLSTDVFAIDDAELVGVDYDALRCLSAADKLRAAADVVCIDEGVARLIMLMAKADLDRQQERLK